MEIIIIFTVYINSRISGDFLLRRPQTEKVAFLTFILPFFFTSIRVKLNLNFPNVNDVL